MRRLSILLLCTVSTAELVVYIQHTWRDLHAETFFTYAHAYCGRAVRWSHPFPFANYRGPRRIFVGPADAVTPADREIWTVYNTTECPVFIGTPSSPNVTVVTTWTPQRDKRMNASAWVLVVHNSAPAFWEQYRPSNVYWLTPAHENWVLPFVFPSYFTRQRRNWTDKAPIFTVQGGRARDGKRNFNGLGRILTTHVNRSFIIRIVGKSIGPRDVDKLRKLPGGEKVQWVNNGAQRLDAWTWMMAVGVESYGVLPLVDETNYFSTYASGRKLTGSVSWAVGFNMPCVLWHTLRMRFASVPMHAFTYEHQHGIEVAFGAALDDFERRWR
jgi:hypothetical protein